MCARRAQKQFFLLDATLKEKELQDNIWILLGWNSIKCKFDVLNVSQTCIQDDGKKRKEVWLVDLAKQ